MKRNNKKLYEKIMRSVSKLVKRILNEDVQYFDVTDYEDDDTVDHQTIYNMSYKYFPKNKKELESLIILLKSENLTKPNLLEIDTSKITDMSKLFKDLGNIKYLDLSTWDTSNVTNMEYMFMECTSLENVNLSGWDTSKVTNMHGMFYNCKPLNNIDLSDFNTSNVKSTSNMFGYCKSLERLDLSGWDTSNVIDMSYMFNQCESLNNINLSNWVVDNVEMICGMFNGCYSLTNLDLSGWNIYKVRDTTFMFNGCYSLTNLDLSGWNMLYVKAMNHMFNGCSSLVELNLLGWDIPDIGSKNIFRGCTSLKIVHGGNNCILQYFQEFKTSLMEKDLYENILEFNVTDYSDSSDDLVDYNTVNDMLKNQDIDIDETKILWSDLTVYMLDDIINDIPGSGYPIGINIIDDKYVSLKYMSKTTPLVGSKTPEIIPFINIRYDKYDRCPDVLFVNDIYNNLYNIKTRIKFINSIASYKPLNNKIILKEFIDKFKYFEGKEQTLIIFDDISEKGDYPAAESVYEFNPGETLKGSWYIPEIGELCQIFAMMSVINYICQVLKNKGYNDIYDELDEYTYWSSTFWSRSAIYTLSMGNYRIYSFDKGSSYIVLPMYQLKGY